MKKFLVYEIKNNINNKSYIGQTLTHRLNHKRYRPYGHEGRFRCHISEAFSSKKNQSHYLNNAIRKYGANDFTVELGDKLVDIYKSSFTKSKDIITSLTAVSDFLTEISFNRIKSDF